MSKSKLNPGATSTCASVTAAIGVSIYLISGTTSALAAQNAAYLKMKVYGVWFVENADCTGTKHKLFEKDAPEEVDLLTGPTLGGGDIPDGTYNCIIFKMDDIIKYAAVAVSAGCTSLDEQKIDLCRSNDSAPFGTTTNLDGVSSTCVGTSQRGSGAVANPVWLYISTGVAANGSNNGNSFAPPSGNQGGIKLDTPLVISGTGQSKFVVDANGKVDTGQEGAVCDMQPPTMSFVKL